MLSFLWTKPGIFRWLVPGYLASFRPSFHRDPRALVARWRDRLVGEGAPLSDRHPVLLRGPSKLRRARAALSVLVQESA